MLLSRANSPILSFVDLLGHPLTGGTLSTFISGTDVPVATYKDKNGTKNTPVIRLNSRGECEVWLDPAVNYRFVVKNAIGVTIMDKGDISADTRTFEAEGDGIIVTESRDEDGRTVVSFSIADNSIGREQLKGARDLIVDSQYLKMERQEGSSEVILSLAAEVPSNDGTYVLKIVNGTMQWVAE